MCTWKVPLYRTPVDPPFRPPQLLRHSFFILPKWKNAAITLSFCASIPLLQFSTRLDLLKALM
jgi:hypothetical protein